MATLIDQFTWIPMYEELARELATWENRQEELVSFLEELRAEGYVITPLYDKDADGAQDERAAQALAQLRALRRGVGLVGDGPGGVSGPPGEAAEQGDRGHGGGAPGGELSGSGASRRWGRPVA